MLQIWLLLSVVGVNAAAKLGKRRTSSSSGKFGKSEIAIPIKTSQQHGFIGKSGEVQISKMGNKSQN
jgi:hypothetical protein